MVRIEYDDLSAAFDFVSFAAPLERHAFVSLDTGAIYWVSETSPIEDEELPDDLETSDRGLSEGKSQHRRPASNELRSG
jgi:hypothetical protein